MDVNILVTALGQTLEPDLRQQAEAVLEGVSLFLINAHHAPC